MHQYINLTYQCRVSLLMSRDIKHIQIYMKFNNMPKNVKRNLMAKCITFREEKYHFREQTRTIGKSCEKVPS